MKKIASLLVLVLFIAVTACSTQQPTPTPVPATITPVPPTATATFTPTPTATPKPLPPIELEHSQTFCVLMSSRVGQTLVVGSSISTQNEAQTKKLISSASVSIQVDGQNPVVVTDPGLWSKPVMVDLGKWGKYYQSDFKWNLPNLEAGDHYIQVQTDSVVAPEHPMDFYCDEVSVLPLDYEATQAKVSMILDWKNQCGVYEIKEGQPIELVDIGYSDITQKRVRTFIADSLEKIIIDGGDPISVSDPTQWSEPTLFHNLGAHPPFIADYYFTTWTGPLPVALAKGMHTIEVQFTAKSTGINVNSGCVDVTVK